MLYARDMPPPVFARGGYICFSQGVHLLYNRSKLTSRHKTGVYLYSSKNLKVLLIFQSIFCYFTQTICPKIF